MPGGFRIQNNIASLNSYNRLYTNTLNLNKSLEKLSSGYRINSAADDAAGMASSMRFRAEIAGLTVASRNANEATSLLQVAEGAYSQVDLILTRLKELAVQAASGQTGTDRAKIDTEAQQLLTEINRISSFTKYSGQTLLDGNFGAVTLSGTTPVVDFTEANGIENIDISSAARAADYWASARTATSVTLSYNDGTTTIAQTVSVDTNVDAENENGILDFSTMGVKLTYNQFFVSNGISSVDTSATYNASAGQISTADTLGNANFQLGDKNDANHRIGFTLDGLTTTVLGINALDLNTVANAQTALGTVDTAISTLGTQRATVGSYINRFTYAASNLGVSIENKTASESTIRDVDMANEMANFTKNQILVQASTAMLAQANATPQAVLSLIR